jgi:PD-(D/E)XK nuclease superfamily
VNELTRFTEVVWDMREQVDHAWFRGSARPRSPSTPRVTAELSANPKSEVIEALRWVRQLLSSGRAKAEDIAIAATSTQDWDDHVLSYAGSAGLPVHFSQGVPALSRPEGQACAALADLLTNSLSQERVWRLIRRLPNRPFLNALPDDWFAGIPRGAGLRSLDHWRQAMSIARPHRATGELAERVLLPVLELIAQGPVAGREVGWQLLSGASLAIWTEALESGPPHAVVLSLQALRITDGRDPANNVVWCPASHLAASPRPFTRLLGLTSRSWPRAENDDPLIPDHVLSRRTLRPVTMAERDRLNFEVIRAGTERVLILSRPARNAKGSVQSPSALWPAVHIVRKRDRIPGHAFSEADRLLARPQDAGQLPHVRQSQMCWRNWHRQGAHTPHDGLVPANHPAITSALARGQSTTTLQRLLRDPLGFVWREALGWRSVRLEPAPLQLDPFTFGELVHALISGAITTVEPTPGFARASHAEIAEAIERTSASVVSSWPLQRSVPPPVLWTHTVREAARRTSKGLSSDDPTRAGTRSWSEVPFGKAEADPNAWPWDATIAIPISEAGLTYGGRIDRIDIRASGDGAQITDYKSANPPPKSQRIALGQGRELQRVLYAMAVRGLLPEVRTVVARLIYLADEPTTFELRGDELERAIADAKAYLVAAVAILRSGRLAPRWEQDGHYDDMRLALPADRESYLRRKAAEFRAANQTLAKLWNAST